MKFTPPVKLRKWIEFADIPESRLHVFEERGIDPYDEPCWIWTGSKNSAGYGQKKFNGRTWNTHRLCWQILSRKFPQLLERLPLPGTARDVDGDILDHLCEVRLCCNPVHLEKISQSENVIRGARHRD